MPLYKISYYNSNVEYVFEEIINIPPNTPNPYALDIAVRTEIRNNMNKRGLKGNFSSHRYICISE